MIKKLGHHLKAETDKFGQEEHYHIDNYLGDEYTLYDEILESLPKTGFYWLKQIANGEILLFHRKHRKEPIIHLHRYRAHGYKNNIMNLQSIEGEQWRIKLDISRLMRKQHPEIVNEIISIINNTIERSQKK